MNIVPIPPDTVDRLSDLVHKLAGPMAEEFGLLLGDKVRAYRAQNLRKTLGKTKRILDASNIDPAAVSPRILIPIIEASSLEDSEALQALWAGLLATASVESDDFAPSFIETLKQLTPTDAGIFEDISNFSMTVACKTTLEEYMKVVVEPPEKSRFISSAVLKSAYQLSTFERLGLLQREYKVSGSLDHYSNQVENDVDYWYSFTDYAVHFLSACHGPLKPEHSEGQK